MQITFSATNRSHQTPVAPHLDGKTLLEVKILFQCLGTAGLIPRLNRPGSESLYVRIWLLKPVQSGFVATLDNTSPSHFSLDLLPKKKLQYLMQYWCNIWPTHRLGLDCKLSIKVRSHSNGSVCRKAGAEYLGVLRQKFSSSALRAHTQSCCVLTAASAPAQSSCSSTAPNPI